MQSGNRSRNFSTSCSKCNSTLVDLFSLNPRNYSKGDYYCNSCKSDSKPKKKSINNKPKQHSFSNSLPDCSIEVIKNNKKLDNMLKNGDELKFISYSTSIDSLLDFIGMGYKKIEYVCGEYLIDSFKNHLSEKKLSDVKLLTDYVREGRLEVYVPKKGSFHSKLYIVKDGLQTRVALGSANATRSGRKGRMHEIMAFYNFNYSHRLLKEAEKAFDLHKSQCNRFFDDLIKLIDEKPQEESEKVIEYYLKSNVKRYADGDAKEFYQVTKNALEIDDENSNEMITISLNNLSRSKTSIMNELKVFKPIKGDDYIKIPKKKFLDEKNHMLPPMHYNPNGEIIIGLSGREMLRTANDLNPNLVDQALNGVEEYFRTVDMATCGDSGPENVKMNMAEAMFSVFTAPFAHELMKIKRRNVGLSDDRGLRFPVIYGPSHNGKSFFSKLMLYWITGKSIKPQHGSDFVKTKLEFAQSFGTCFPLIFDDVPADKLGEKSKDIFVEYYERRWTQDVPSPYPIITTNKYKLKDWATSRSKKLSFDVYFEASIANKKLTTSFLERPNEIFLYFSKIFSNKLKLQDDYNSDDENKIAREVWSELYGIANRQMPSYFPMKSLDELYDPGIQQLHNLVYRDKIAILKDKGDVLNIKFPDFAPYEVADVKKLLSPKSAAIERGTTITIRNPKAFWNWLIPGYENLGKLRRWKRRRYG